MNRAWLTIIRKKEGKSQKQMAEKSSITQQYYNYIERGERCPSTKIAKKIAAILNFEKHGYEWTKFFEDDTAIEQPRVIPMKRRLKDSPANSKTQQISLLDDQIGFYARQGGAVAWRA